MRNVLLLTALFLSSAGLVAAQDGTAALGQRYTGWFYTGDLSQLWGRFSPEMKKDLNLDKLGAFRQQVAAQLGTEASVLSERVIPSRSGRVYVRTAKFERAEPPIVVQWTMNARGHISGLRVQPAPSEARSPHLGYQTKTPLRLPLAGEWFVSEGGRMMAENYHAA